MEIKHTPGPWSVGKLLLTNTTNKWTQEEKEKTEAIEKAAIFANFHISDKGKSRIFIANTNRDLPEVHANARLIAAAPEMLEALKADDDWLCENVPTSNRPASLDAKRIAAIAKAEKG